MKYDNEFLINNYNILIIIFINLNKKINKYCKVLFNFILLLPVLIQIKVYNTVNILIFDMCMIITTY